MSEKPTIVSLGYNCEISFRIENYFNKLDSYLFSWSFEEDRELFLKALENIDSIFINNISLREDHMFADENYKIKFHPRYDILPKAGMYSEISYKDALNELTGRIAHLKDKTKTLFKEYKKVVYFVKVQDLGEESNISYIIRLEKLLRNLSQTGDYVLVAVFEKRSLTKKIKDLESCTLKIRGLKKFAPVKHTDILGDVKGWYKIISEFVQEKSKCYFSNIRKKRREIIPSMILSKLKKVLKVK